jgi:phosphohistidine phosphatase
MGFEIYILRHGIAGDPESPGYLDDSKRPLTKEGRKKMRRIARAMRSMKLEFDLIISSPFLRAKETAGIVHKIFGNKMPLRSSPKLEPCAPYPKLIRELPRILGKNRSILLVGHEPFLSAFISGLMSGNAECRIEMKKGGLCKVSADRLGRGQHWKLEWLLTPAQLLRMSS